MTDKEEAIIGMVALFALAAIAYLIQILAK